MPDLHLSLPLPPSVNHSHYGNRHVTTSTRRWRNTAHVLVWDEIACQRWNRVPPDVTSCVTLSWHWPDRRRRDPNNYHKELFDILTKAGVWTDDQWTVIEGEEFDIDKARAGVEVVVRRPEQEVGA